MKRPYRGKLLSLLLIVILIAMSASLAYALPPLNLVPNAPTDLAAVPVSASEIKIDWTDNSTNETGFKVERAKGGGAFLEITTVGGNVTTYADTGLSANTEYTYRVRAYNGFGNSTYSNSASATTLFIIIVLTPAAPTNLTASAVSNSEIKIDWTDKSNNETGFKIERAKGGGIFTEITSLGANVTTYSDTGLSANTEYTYRVRAYNGFGSSGYSNSASATTFFIILIPTPPLAPADLTANSVSSTRIVLDWADKSSNESGFKIERREGSAPFTVIDTVAANTTSYSNTGLDANTTYNYRVMAYNGFGNSAYTNTATAKTKTPPPAGSTTTLRFYIASGDYFVNGGIRTMDTAPIIKDGRTVLPIRYVVEPLGGEVFWDNIDKMVTISMGSDVIKLWVGNNTANVNGTNVFIDPENANVMPIIIPPGRTMLPLRFIAETLGCEVSWLAGPKEVTVVYEAP
jgi:titin